MRDFIELVAAIIVVILVVLAVLFIVSLPFAFIGFILLLAVSIFTDVTITYMSCLVLGIAASIIGAIIKS